MFCGTCGRGSGKRGIQCSGKQVKRIPVRPADVIETDRAEFSGKSWKLKIYYYRRNSIGDSARNSGLSSLLRSFLSGRLSV